jgi:hypothetical protein
MDVTTTVDAVGTTGWSKPAGAPAATWTITDVVPR